MLRFEKFKPNNVTDWAADARRSPGHTREAVNSQVVCLQGVVRKRASGWRACSDTPTHTHTHTSTSAVDVSSDR